MVGCHSPASLEGSCLVVTFIFRDWVLCRFLDCHRESLCELSLGESGVRSWTRSLENVRSCAWNGELRTDQSGLDHPPFS